MVSGSSANVGSYGSVNVILTLLEFLENEGHELQPILDRAGLPKVALEEAGTRFPQNKIEALWEAASEVTGDPAVALRVSTMVKPRTLGIIGYLASASESARNAFELVKGLTPLLWEGFECDLYSEGEVAFMRCSAGRGSRANLRMAEWSVGLAVTMSRVLGGSRSDPLEARFSYPPPAHAEEYERILELPVRFDAEEDGVLFPISMLERSNWSADSTLRQLLQRYAAEQLANLSTGARVSQRVRAYILSMLPMEDLTAGTVAAQFSMSDRTLRRRLREEGASFQEILDDVRVELARHYLCEEKHAIDEVAQFLRFSDSSAFTRAFRRWTGQTPADFVRASSSSRTHPSRNETS
ncbi:MAG: AraC family transcriptional regulator [bacterium]|nr:AraC family transcriptional regulator [bacterium]